jgi:rhodanese-related sulfurtransferase
MAADGFANLSPAEVAQALTDGAVLIDVREPYEFEAARIAGALNYPLSSFDPMDLPQDRPLILSCARGARSVTAMHICAEAGVPFEGHLAGGLQAWMMAGLPVER